MLVKEVTKQRQKKGRYIKSQLVLRGIQIRDIALQIGCSQAFVRMVISGVRKHEKVQRAIADMLKKPYVRLWCEKKEKAA